MAIGNLERFAADYERESGQISLPKLAPKNGRRVAVVGSGPAGLTFAGDMAKLGYDVTVFEALHEIGGVLKYGIPEFRLPNRIVDVEISQLEKMGGYLRERLPRRKDHPCGAIAGRRLCRHFRRYGCRTAQFHEHSRRKQRGRHVQQ